MVTFIVKQKAAKFSFQVQGGGNKSKSTTYSLPYFFHRHGRHPNPKSKNMLHFSGDQK